VSGGSVNITDTALTANHYSSHTSHKTAYTLAYKALQFLTASSLLLALNSSMVVVFSFFLYGQAVVPQMLAAAFLVTFSVYGLNKVTDKKEDAINKPELTTKRTDYYLAGSVASMIVGLAIGLLQSATAFIILIMPLVIGVVYSIKICKSMPRLKEITGVKSIVVALSWAIPGCFLPALSGFSLLIAGCVFFFIFIKVFVGAVLCDVLDTSGDAASGVLTVPVKLGLKNTKLLLIALNTLSLLLPIYCALRGLLAQFLPVFFFGSAYGFLSIWWFFSKRCTRVSAGLMLDGEWLPLVLIAGLLLM
jgi:4-hydroxybenzoate polyprenyltransferase